MMSEDNDHNTSFVEKPCAGVAAILRASEKDLGGFSVRRYIPHLRYPRVGPFVFFDHMGPARFAPGEGIDVRPHPHIGLATITWLFEGEIWHRDSLGFVQPITPGAVNWMTAGRGIVHSERTGPETRAAGHYLHGLQVWVGLPEDHEEVEPAFVHIAANDIPVLQHPGVTLRLVAGTLEGETSPLRTYSPLLYVDVTLSAGSAWRLPPCYSERAVHVVAGQVQIHGHTLATYDMGILEQDAPIRIEAHGDARVVIFGGEPITHRYVWWNFVSSSRERIEQAKADWREGWFAPVPGETEFIPLPERK